MFSVKATYHNETRKLTFSDPSFPSYNQICNQLYRVFPISNSYYLSKLLFCPTEGSRVLVGMEVHNEPQYNSYIAPFVGRAWPGGSLRFSVFDDTPHKVPNTTIPGGLIYSDSWPNVTSREPTKLPTSPRVPLASILPHSNAGPSPMDIDHDSRPTSATSSRQPCCSMEKGKVEMRDLMSNFLREFTSTMSATFGDIHEPISTPRAVATDLATPIPGVQHRVNMEASTSLPIPGSFIERTARASGVEEGQSKQQDKPVHPNVWCDYCGRAIRGVRSKCSECSNYDLCEDCIVAHDAINLHKARYSQGEEHAFRPVEAPAPTLPFAPSNAQDVPMQPPNSTSSAEVNNAAPAIHVGIVCDVCNETIVGKRHKCLDCPDYDLCSDCMPQASQLHNEGHEFFTIEEPGHVIVHTVFSGEGSPKSSKRARRNSWISRPMAPAAPAEPVAHNAICNLCDSRIRGDRHKCVDCPDFDTCTSCYSITPEQHPGHVFVKVSTPQDLVSEQLLMSGRWHQYNYDQSKKSSDHFARHNARCNACDQNICGVRYKCMHPRCPDFDLCENCEALPIPVHPSNHPLLKMRSPDTVVPTVYRVGGAHMISNLPTAAAAQVRPSTSEVSVVAKEHVAETTEAAVQLIQPEMADAAVSATIEVADVTPKRGLPTPPQPWPLNPFMASNQAEHSHNSFASKPTLDCALPGSFLNTGILMDERARPQTRTPSAAASATDAADVLNASSIIKFPALTPCPVSPQPFVPGVITLPGSFFGSLGVPVEERPEFTTGPISAPETSLFAKFPIAPKSSMDLRAMFISDSYIQDGQIFPAGAEFIKSWQMQNDGDIAWPETTEVVFVAGDRLPAFEGAPCRYHVGRVEPGQIVSIYAGDMKTPEIPGKYVSYWRLNDGTKPFGQSVWCDIIVPEAEQVPQSNDSSLSSSAVIMPVAAPERASETSITGGVSHTPASLVLNTNPSTIMSTPTLASETSTPVSEDGDSSISLIDHSDYASDNSEMWEDTRSQAVSPQRVLGDVEYVVLYDDDSSSADGA